MLRTIAGLQNVNVLGKQAQKQVNGGVVQPCGVKVNGVWCQVGDFNHNGGTIDDAQGMLGTSQSCSDGTSGTVTNWCCDSCYWN